MCIYVYTHIQIYTLYTNRVEKRCCIISIQKTKSRMWEILKVKLSRFFNIGLIGTRLDNSKSIESLRNQTWQKKQSRRF